MNISLETIDIWKIEGGFDAAGLFSALPKICFETDVLGIGSYHLFEEASQWLQANEIQNVEEKPFDDRCFDVNRKQYPHGKSYALHAGPSQLLHLSLLSGKAKGGVEKDLFFDHLLIYRSGEPIIPLLDFHDAFTGGELYLSGLYSQAAVQSFATALGVHAERVKNPILLKKNSPTDHAASGRTCIKICF
jgi:hypothetical protein